MAASGFGMKYDLLKEQADQVSVETAQRLADTATTKQGKAAAQASVDERTKGGNSK